MTTKHSKDQVKRFSKVANFGITRKHHFGLGQTNQCAIFTLLILLTVLLCPGLSAAVQESELNAAFESKILPFFTTQFQFGTMQGAGGIAIHYAKREIAEEQAVLIIVDGRTEYAEKYAELLYDLNNLPWSVYIYDHRGQGLSGRLLNDPQKGHVDAFANYVDDLKKFISTVVRPTPQRRLFILAHSMGGTITALYGIDNPGVLKGIILCSPMLRINTAPFPGKIVRFFAQAMTALGGGRLYAFGGRPYDQDRSFADNKLTHSLARFELNKKILKQFPKNKLGSPTFQWLNESFKGMEAARERTGGLRTPVLLLEGGADTVVGRKAEDHFCSQLPHCTPVRFTDGRHELLMEEDAIRDTILERIKKFIPAYNRHETISGSGD